jgi:glycosyltransferase involved in cell wall biosynthesis
MKIALISGANSIHTIRWANGLSGAGHEVHVISQHPAVEHFDQEVTVHEFPFRGVLGYFLIVPAVRKLLHAIKPDIVNAHYASGYGTTARLVGYSPWVLSVWGSDVYDFPFKSPLHKWLVQKNIKSANRVASTSHCMAVQTCTLAGSLSEIAITPFGVEMSAFPNVVPEVAKVPRKLTIGTVKTMNPKYGIDTLINAFAILVARLAMLENDIRPDIKLRLVGGGDQTAELKALAEQLGISDKVAFIGQVPHAQVPHELSKLDIYVALSRLDSESFGVAILEAGAAALPVVVSDAGGLPEVTVDGVTGIVVPRDDPSAAAGALERLVLDADLTSNMGLAGRAHVSKNYSWPSSIKTMLDVYEQTIQAHIGKKT